MDIAQWVHDTIERWATYDGCPCSKARRSHAEFMADQLSREKTPDITEPLGGLGPTKSGADFEYHAVAVLGIMKRVAERMQGSIFGLLPKLAEYARHVPNGATWTDADEELYKHMLRERARGTVIYEGAPFIDPVRVEDALFKLSARRSAAMNNIVEILGESTVNIVGKVELLDREKFDKWFGDIKEAVSVLHKEDKTTDDILAASTRLAELLDTEPTKAFLRMLDSGLFDSIVDKVDKVEKGIVDEPEKAAADEPEKAAVDEQKKRGVEYISFGGNANYAGRPQPVDAVLRRTVSELAWPVALGFEKEA